MREHKALLFSNSGKNAVWIVAEMSPADTHSSGLNHPTNSAFKVFLVGVVVQLVVHQGEI